MAVGDGVDPIIITSRDGSVVVRGGGAVDLSSSGGGSITPFRFIPILNGTTTGPGLVPLLTVPNVVVLRAGTVLLDFSGSIEVETLPESALSQGANFDFLWDGLPIPPTPPCAFSQTAFMQQDMPQAILSPETFSNQIRLRDIVQATVGNHSLVLRFEGLGVESVVIAFEGSGALTIQGAP